MYCRLTAIWLLCKRSVRGSRFGAQTQAICAQKVHGPRRSDEHLLASAWSVPDEMGKGSIDEQGIVLGTRLPQSRDYLKVGITSATQWLVRAVETPEGGRCARRLPPAGWPDGTEEAPGPTAIERCHKTNGKQVEEAEVEAGVSKPPCEQAAIQFGMPG